MSEVKQLVWPWTRCGLVLRLLQGQRLGDRHFVGKEIHQESASLASTLNVDGILMVYVNGMVKRRGQNVTSVHFMSE